MSPPAARSAACRDRSDLRTASSCHPASIDRGSCDSRFGLRAPRAGFLCYANLGHRGAAAARAITRTDMGALLRRRCDVHRACWPRTRVVSSDICDRGFGRSGVDFLACRQVAAGCRAIVTNPPYGDSGSHNGQSRSPSAMLGFLRHSLALTASVQGQLALLVRLQWIAGRRAAEMMSAAPFAAPSWF